jgi:hypothetical protein
VILDKQVVRFRLSPEGKVALKGLFSRQSFQARVEEVDELGAWVMLGSTAPLILLKWEYFATAVVDFKPQPDAERQAIGFQAGTAKKTRKRLRS